MLALGERAVVLGASMGGMLAARVLADFYRTVTVVEREVLPDDPVNRRGVPQGRHLHVLLARGSQILGELFPGFLDELVADGVSVWSDGDLTRICLSFGGHQMVRSGTVPDPQSMPFYYPSRPFLEWNVRRRLRGIPNVTILEGYDVVGLTSTSDRERVTGARLVSRDGGGETTLTADLVVDATGRGSRTPVFLDELGYGRPREDELVVRLAYASQPLRIPAGALREDLIAVFPEPGRLTTFGLVRYENDTWLFTMGSMMGHEPPKRARRHACLSGGLRTSGRACGCPSGRTTRGDSSLSRSVQPVATLRQDAPNSEGPARLRRRDQQLQPHLRTRHDRRRRRSGRVARLPAPRRA
jgi:hypothetical protein